MGDLRFPVTAGKRKSATAHWRTYGFRGKYTIYFFRAPKSFFFLFFLDYPRADPRAD